MKFFLNHILKHQTFRKHLTVFFNGQMVAGLHGCLEHVTKVDEEWGGWHLMVPVSVHVRKCLVFKIWFREDKFNLHETNPEPSNIHVCID